MTTEEQLLDAEEDARACLAAAAALESVERELAAAHEGAEVHREVTRHLVSEVSRLRRERDRALACEAAALGLVSERCGWCGGTREAWSTTGDEPAPCPKCVAGRAPRSGT